MPCTSRLVSLAHWQNRGPHLAALFSVSGVQKKRKKLYDSLSARMRKAPLSARPIPEVSMQGGQKAKASHCLLAYW